MRALLLATLSSTLAFGCTTNGRDPVQHVFMTSAEYDGNLVAAAGDPTLDGPAAADVLCNRAAANAHRGGTWTAWISVGDGSNLDDPTAPGYLQTYAHAAYRLAAIDRIVGNGPWFTLSHDASGTSEAVLFLDRNALANGGNQDAFYDELGNLPAGSSGATTWTGTRTDGQPTSWDCAGWTLNTSAGLGVAGAEADYSDVVDLGSTWTDDAALSCRVDSTRCPDNGVANHDAHGWGAIPCGLTAKLYCFENTPS